MQTAVRQVEDVTIVDLDGDLVVGDGDEVLRGLVDDLLAAGRRKILLNLTRVSRMDSSGIGELVAGWKTAKHLGASIRLLRPGDRVKYTLHLSQVLPLLDVYEDEGLALADFATA